MDKEDLGLQRHRRADRLADVREWRWLAHPSRPNGLLIGAHGATDAVLRLLEASLRHPLRHWPCDGAAWTIPAPAPTVVLHEVTSLRGEDQRSLFAWMNVSGHGAQVISLATRPVYPMVETGVFLEALYYRINSVVVDCRGVETDGVRYSGTSGDGPASPTAFKLLRRRS